MLSQTSSSNPPSGQTYFISDGSPIENFEFLKPLCEVRGCDYPQLIIPTEIMLWFAYLCELVYYISYSISIPTETFLTQAEVYKVGITHYFSIRKAKTDINYEPKLHSAEGAQRMAKYYSNSLSVTNFYRFPHLIWWFLVLTGMMLTWIIAYDMIPSNSSYYVLIQPIESFSLALFRTRFVVKLVFLAALIAHSVESMIAYYYAVYLLNCSETWLLWTMQTFVLGYPSLRYLIGRQKFLESHRKKRI
jgi:hypothetical protein